MTVFLTTQYLEEADVLADRVGIIDHGHIVAEGTPTDLKAQIGRPTVEITPADPEQRDRVAEILRRFGELVQVSPDSVAVRCAHGDLDLAEIIRALDAEGLPVANLQLHAPSLDDVFLEKTGRTLEGAAAEAGRARAGAGSTGERRPRSRSTTSPAARSSARRRQPANVVAPMIFPLGLLAVNSGGPPAGDVDPRLSRPTASSPSRSRSRSCRARCSRR